MNQYQINKWIQVELNYYNSRRKELDHHLSCIKNYPSKIKDYITLEEFDEYELGRIDKIRNDKDCQQEKFDQYFKNTLTDDDKAFNQLFIDYIINGEGVKEIKGNKLIPTQYFLDIVLPEMYNLYETSQWNYVNEIHLQHLEYHRLINYSGIFEKRLYRNIMTFRVSNKRIKFENGTYMSVPKRVIRQLRNPK